MFSYDANQRTFFFLQFHKIFILRYVKTRMGGGGGGTWGTLFDMFYTTDQTIERQMNWPNCLKLNKSKRGGADQMF
jgi:hypothetical protein